MFVNVTNIGDFNHFVGICSWVWPTSYWLSCLPCCSGAAQIASLGYSHTCRYQGATFPCRGGICIKVKQLCWHDSLITCVVCDSTFISTWSLVTSCNFHHSSAHHQDEQMSNLNNWKHLCECAGPLNFTIPACKPNSICVWHGHIIQRCYTSLFPASLYPVDNPRD